MKKTIAILALSAASNSAFGLYFPGPVTKDYKTICLPLSQNDAGVFYTSNCDSVQNNIDGKLPILENGCAEGQVALTATSPIGKNKFDIKIKSCLAPNIAQL